MLVHVLLLFLTNCLHETFANGHCIDIHSHIVSQGLHYVPGPNTCTLCICDKGSPKWCKSVLCSPPQNCKSFEVGASCCEFKCLDGILTKNENYSETYDLALRLIASLVTAILSLSLLFFLIHRLRQRKIRVRQNRQLSEDQRSLNSIGYIAGSLGYLPGSIGYLGAGSNELEFHYEESGVHYPLWKPPGNYFPRGEAPPPYEEAVRSARVENNLLNNQVRTENNITVAHTTNVNISPMQQATVSSYHPPAASVSVQQSNNPNLVQCRHESTITNPNTPSNNQEYANITIQSVTIHQATDNAVHQAAEDGTSSVEAPPDNRCITHGGHSHEAVNKSVHRSDRAIAAVAASAESSKSYENIIIHPSRNDWPTTSADSAAVVPPPLRSALKTSKAEGHGNLESVSSASKTTSSASSSNRYENVILKNGSTILKDVYTLKKQQQQQHHHHHLDNKKSMSSLVSMRPEYLYDDLNNGERFYENTRHRTIPNLQDFQGPKEFSSSSKGKIKELPLHPAPKRDLDKSRIGERSLENNLKGLMTLVKDRKEIAVHRTLPKNLRELCLPAAPPPVSAICSAEPTMNRPYSNNLMHRSLPKHLSMQVETPLSVNLAQQSYIGYVESKDRLSLKSSVAELISPQTRVCNIEMEDLSSKLKNIGGGGSGASTAVAPPVAACSSSTSAPVAVSAAPDLANEKCGHSSYQCLSSASTAAIPDEDDYRSECENCKSSSYQEGDGEEGDLVNETMTLQRRPLEPGEEVPYYRTSLTLPTNTRKPRAVTPNPGRESWFMAMQETSSSDESE